MTSRHVCLLVEDDPDLRADLVGRLDALGYDCVCAETLAEGLEKLEAGGFCFAVVDLQIKKTADAARAYPECGLGLVDAIRERYPGRNDQDRHVLPVLIMSGYGKEPDYIRRGFHAGADDVLRKPLEENRPDLETVIERCLERSGRTKHSFCGRVELAARRAAERRALGRDDGKVRIEITAERNGRRFEAHVQGRLITLQPNSLHMLLHLAAARLDDAEGWVDAKRFEIDVALVWRTLARLKVDVGELTGGVALLENDRAGNYRLNPAVSVQLVDSKKLDSHWDRNVRELAALLRGGAHL